MIDFSMDTVDWKKGAGLVPVIVQDYFSLKVLMLGYMNKDALAATLQTELVTFYSRSKQRLWQKGETSGHVLNLKSIQLDCDADTILIKAMPQGPSCHLGTITCFGSGENADLSVLAELSRTVKDRKVNPKEGSYTSKLFQEGPVRIAQKVGEEGLEVALAAATGSATIVDEAADLMYHLIVLLESTPHSLQDVLTILKQRSSK